MAYSASVGGGSSMTTRVDCHKQVRSWRLLRSLIEFLIPTCNCSASFSEEDTKSQNFDSPPLITSATITGTIFGYRNKGKVSFCIQSSANSATPILLLELAVPTSTLAKEMRGGTLRIALESPSSTGGYFGNCDLLFSTPLWTMYCNGRKVGYAVKRVPSNADFKALRLLRSVAVGTGQQDELMYLRANFQRVRGSSKSNCESFHLIDPEGSIAQELSIFFFRSWR